jgi:hypothetical protein
MNGGVALTMQTRLYLKEHLDNSSTVANSNWNRAFPSRHPTVEAQRASIVAILCRLATPGCEVSNNIAP